VILESATWRLPATEIEALPTTVKLAAGAR
jgi:hypothetical protein